MMLDHVGWLQSKHRMAPMIHNGKSDNSGVHGKLDKHVDEMLSEFNATCNMMIRANTDNVMTLK